MLLEDYFTDALLVELNKQIIRSNSYYSEISFKDALKGSVKPPVPNEIIDNVLANLVKSNFVTIVEDDVGGNFCQLEYKSLNRHVIDSVASGEGFLFRYSKVGRPLLESIIDRLYNPEPLKSQEDYFPESTDPLEDIEASDRVVSRSDNLPAIKNIDELINDAKIEINTSNEVGEVLGNEREIISLEFDIAQEVISKPRFRLKSLLNWLLPALKYLSDKFSGSALAEIAKRLVDLLLDLH